MATRTTWEFSVLHRLFSKWNNLFVLSSHFKSLLIHLNESIKMSLVRACIIILRNIGWLFIKPTYFIKSSSSTNHNYFSWLTSTICKLSGPTITLTNTNITTLIESHQVILQYTLLTHTIHHTITRQSTLYHIIFTKHVNDESTLRLTVIFLIWFKIRNVTFGNVSKRRYLLNFYWYLVLLTIFRFPPMRLSFRSFLLQIFFVHWWVLQA